MTSCSGASCPHLSLPVETDESMTSWPTCQECVVCADDITPPCDDIMVNGRLRGVSLGLPVRTDAPRLATPTKQGDPCPPAFHHLMGHMILRPHDDEPCESDVAMIPAAAYGARWNIPGEDEESLEQPLPLRSVVEEKPKQIVQLRPMQSCPQCPKCPPAMAQPTDRVRDAPEMMSEVCVLPSPPIMPDHFPTQEVRRTISLPEDCRTLFITYSVDVGQEIFPFVAFLINQGFRPVIDIFDNAVRQMDSTKWMDSYLKNKSVLIIMIISPKYKTDVEGDGADQHGLHTKYIYSQLQNEFIQQRCLNFRLIPVLFPSANRHHVPLWLQSTCVFRWPNDAQDLLLRLLREERYIPPPRRRDPTISIRPV